MELEVLVAAMGQTDLSLPEKMNLERPALIGNQCGVWGYEEQGNVRMVSTATRGVGLNRNYALSLARGDILLFADDDMVYYDPGLQGVVDAFAAHPKADAIFFSIDKTLNGEISESSLCRTKRLQLWNSMSFGTYRIAIRRSAVEKHRLSFSPLFGGGSKYGSGEDSIFIRDCFRAGLTVYSHSYVLGATAKDSSSWFTGYNEKFMFDKGAFLACAFPKAKHLIKWHFIRRFHSRSELSLREILLWMDRGIEAFGRLESYDEYIKRIGG